MDYKDEEPLPQEQPRREYKTVGCLSIDMGYVRSMHGILTAIITLVSLIALICEQSGVVYLECLSYIGAYSFFGFVSGSAFLTGLIHYIIYMLTFQEKFKFLPWHIADLIWCSLWSLLYLISSAVILATSCGASGFIAAGIFGFGAMVAMATQGYQAYRSFRGDLDRAQTTDVRGQSQEYPGTLREMPPAYTP